MSPEKEALLYVLKFVGLFLATCFVVILLLNTIGLAATFILFVLYILLYSGKVVYEMKLDSIKRDRQIK